MVGSQQGSAQHKRSLVSHTFAFNLAHFTHLITTSGPLVKQVKKESFCSLRTSSAKTDKLPTVMSLESANAEDQKVELDKESLWVMRRMEGRDTKTLQLTAHPLLRLTAQNDISPRRIRCSNKTSKNGVSTCDASSVFIFKPPR